MDVIPPGCLMKKGLMADMSQKPQENALKDSADQDNDKGPGKQSGSIQVELRIVELFADGAVRYANDFGSNT